MLSAFLLLPLFLTAHWNADPPATSTGPVPAASAVPERSYLDVHSYANPGYIRVRHMDLDWNVDFDAKQLQGQAVLSVERTSPDATQPFILDTQNLHIERTEASADGTHFRQASFELGPRDPILGSSLTISVPALVRQVRITYHTDPSAAGLQWLEPAQTAGKKHAYLFTQSEAIHARSWIPLQDSPGVRITYRARVRVPNGLTAVMSAAHEASPDAHTFQFRMQESIPPYLIALAVGDIAFRATGPRTGVYTEPEVIDRAAAEFGDLEKMVQATEELYGPYRWGRYDVLVLPPSFPMGGMENPRLTFATPTILAGDKSLISLICHELAHSWSGNLVTNATWRDFWLNEGFAVYFERRILEKVYGRERAQMEAVLGRQDLEKELATLPPKDQILHIDLTGRDPDDGFSDVPYEKGALFLRTLEESFGRARFDAFLKSYFDHFAFHSIRTRDFADYLQKHLLDSDPARAAAIDVPAWLEQPGIPPSAPHLVSEALNRAAEQAAAWSQGKIRTTDLPTDKWSTQEWLQFLRALPAHLTAAQMAELDRAFHLTDRGNSEIAFQWLMMAIENHYPPAYPRLEAFLTSIGRRKFIEPLYTALVKTPDGKQRAIEIYGKARPAYHPLAVAGVDKILNPKK